MDVRVKAYFLLTTLNSFADFLIADDHLVFWVSLVVARVGICELLFRITHETEAATRFAARVSLLLSCLYWLHKFPFTFESHYWTVQTDLAMIYGLYFSKQTIKADTICLTITQMFCCYYLASGFFKLNTHFFDPDASCGTLFMAQHLSYYLGPFVSYDTLLALAKILKPLSPAATLVVELAMGGVLTLGRVLNHRKLTLVGLLVILYFHLAVCMTPRPNDISMFALRCGTRLVVIHGAATIEQTTHWMMQWRKLLMAAAVAIIAYGMQHDFSPPNWAFAMYVPILAFHQIAVLVEWNSKSKEEEDEERIEQPLEPRKATKKLPVWSHVFTFIAFFYSFGSIILGFHEEASINMFANLKIHGGGTNHWLVPTGLLFHWFTSDSHPYGGGEVRIQATDSRWLEEIYPTDLTHIVEPKDVITKLLTDIGCPPPFYFNSGANRVLNVMEKGWVPYNGKFVQYSVPALEFKRLLGEALERDQDFTLEYVQLPHLIGRDDEEWRAKAVGKRVKLLARGGEISKCTIMEEYNNDGMRVGGRKACPATDLPYLYNSVPWIVKKMSLYHGYPIVYDNGKLRKSIACFGP